MLALLAKSAEQHPLPSEQGPKPTVSSITEAQKQALSQTADAFRGVHLDPNAHHWDDVRIRYLYL
jgi:hypothetical protein